MVVIMDGLATLTLCVFIVLSFCGEVLSDIDQHVDQEIKESFVSFQKNNKQLCSGARVKAKLVLIALNCKLEIRNVYSDIAAVIPALPDDRRVGYTIEDIREVEKTVFSLVILKLPETERLRNVAVISLPERVFCNGMDGGVIRWNQDNNTYLVEPVHNIQYFPGYIAVFDDLWDDYDSFYNQYDGALLLHNKNLVGIAISAVTEPRKYSAFVYVRLHGVPEKINKAMKNLRTLFCFPSCCK